MADYRKIALTLLPILSALVGATLYAISPAAHQAFCVVPMAGG